MTTKNIAYGTYTAMTVTNLQSLAIDTADPYAGWQSARVDNQTTTKALDFEVQILLSTAATAPANDKTVYVYLVPWMYDGGTWTPMANFSTTTRPTGNEGTAAGGLTPGRTQMRWVPSLGAFVCWDNTTATTLITRLTPPSNPRTGTWVIDTLPVSGANAVTPSVRAANNTYGRFFYSPTLNGFGLFNSVSGPVYFYALS